MASDMDSLFNHKCWITKFMCLPLTKSVSCTSLVSLSTHRSNSTSQNIKIYNVFTAGYFLYILKGMFNEGGKVKYSMIDGGAVCP